MVLFEHLRPQAARGLFGPRPRPKVILFMVFSMFCIYLLTSQSSGSRYQVVPWKGPPGSSDSSAEVVLSEAERKKLYEENEQALRDRFAAEYEAAKSYEGNDAIYGNTLSTIVSRDIRSDEHAAALKEVHKKPRGFSAESPFTYNPYPAYHSSEWRKTHRGSYVACQGATGNLIEDIQVFKGHPHDFPAESFGSFEALNIDGNLCFERESRLGQYGLTLVKKNGRPINWDTVDWGNLQTKCLELNKGRYDLEGNTNPYISTIYPELFPPAGPDPVVRPRQASDEAPAVPSKEQDTEPAPPPPSPKGNRTTITNGVLEYEPRTAILLRSYTGKRYTDNDRQVMRALVTELALRTGGEYQVFLLLHVRETAIDIFGSKEAYQSVLDENVPAEFHGITILWNDKSVWDMYPAMTDDQERSVHSAQWLSVQKFSIDHPEFDYVWNWEMDVRFTGHHYDFLEKLAAFAKKQPRRGLWERNDRYYIPSFHGDYDTEFRDDVDRRTRGEQIWGAPKLPFITPAGPKPPVSKPELDDYEWGVGEEADFISVGPIFDPRNSSWVIANHVWGYSDEDHHKELLPRRTTIVTQSRVSKRLLDMMHVENLRGNHVASEMTPQTVALLHSFKAVFAPHPVWFDRPWNGTFLDEWFNPGPRGSSGGPGSPTGWGRERRYQGSTWYYRTEPPPRMYNNWLGYEDTGYGGKSWESKHGRPCLPPMMIHPIKDVHPTDAGFKSGYDLFYG
ncbi:hypothetical protein B0T11DRAFT_20427 [Plectosphaerella cucumerina]|uniref:Uncharacterized protein n=1 Tax=Plectosphaerella cucumerina TaxID=40658 RepID=A0A8K0XAG7_9PEZI|nr:hypothetical protein B0T11DRAFT_20427 [Plectosphaerella cucumerina]